MGSPTIYFYPGGGSKLVKVTLPRVTRLERVNEPQLTTLTSAAMSTVQVYGGTRRRIRLTMERVSMLTTAGKATYSEILAVVSHLESGGAIGFSTDHSRSYAGYLAGTVQPGQSYVAWWGSAFQAWNSSAAPAVGDHVAVETAPMYGLEEQHKVTSYAGSQIGFSDDVVFSHNGLSSLVRWEGFFPALRLDGSAAAGVISNEHWINFTLDLTLVVDAALYIDPSNRYDLADLGIGSTSGSILDVGGSLEARLAANRNSSSGTGFAPAAGISYGARQALLGRV